MLITGDPYTFLLILSLHSKQRSQFSPCIVSPSLPSKTPSLSANVRRRLSDDSTSEQVFTKSHKRTVSHNPKTTVGGMPSASPEKRKMSVFTPIQPLRRGDACLMCRAKKLKCSASKPMCDQCSKRKDRCVYDAVRPASRVEKLERKLAEMEEAELQAVMAARRHSSDTLGLSNGGYGSLDQTTTIGLASAPLPQYDANMFHFQPPNGSPPTTMSNQLSGSSSDSEQALSRPQSMPNPHTNSMHGWSWPAGQNAFSTPLPTTEQMPWSLLSSCNDVSLWDAPMDPEQTTAQSAPTGLGYDLLLGLQPETYNLDPAANIVHQPTTGIAPSSLHHDFNPYPMTTSPEEQGVVNDLLIHAETNTPVQFSEKDISQSARDYLLDLFFCPPRIPSGSEVFSEAQFRAKMTLPLRHRPHSCLLFAMYTTAASSSYIPGVRSLADSLYCIASAKLEDSIAQEDRLLDAINASKMLAKWLLGRARALEGYQMTSKSIALALACQLHKIPSSVYDPTASAKTWNADGSWPLLGPPKDQWDLCERIHAFWASWGNDRGATVLMPWSSLVRDDIITTPLPRRPSDYLDETMNHTPDFRIRDLYLMSQKADIRPPDFIYAYLCASVHLLFRAKNLQSDRRGSGQSYTQLASFNQTERFSARRDCPEAYQEIMDASFALQDRLSQHHQIKLLETPPWTDPDTPLITVCILSTRNWLHDLDDETELDVCISGAREIAAIIKLWIRQLQIEELKDTRNVKTTSRTQNGIGGPYVLTPWFWNADRLVKAAKLLRAMGREEEAQECAEDAAAVIAGLKGFGMLYHVASEQAVLLEQSNVE